jgi:hypothetical protein
VRILFDQGTPAPFRASFAHHAVETAHELGWSTLKNGELIGAAEAACFDVLVTTDKNLKYQQNLTGRSIAIVVLSTTSWQRIQGSFAVVVRAVDEAIPGSYCDVRVE